jgi:20S proteasome alpha/beta subunit
LTTIAYKDGIIAYDSRATVGLSILDHDYNKKISIAGVQFFVCGTVADHEKACKAYFNEEHVECDVEYLAYDKGKFFVVCFADDRMYKVPQSLKSPFAVGSGGDRALTAMDCGLSAKEAVKKAAYRDAGTGGRIRTFKVGRRVKK